MMNYVQEKLKELLLLLENFIGCVLVKLDKVLPPETREKKLRQWQEVSAPFLIAGVVLLVFFLCFRWKTVKTMKAPGTGSDDRMPRDVFESNPRSYFRNLRAKQN